MSQKKQSSGKFHIEFLTTAQKMAWAAFQQSDVLFLIGPAGTGKSHISMAFAIHEILQKSKKKIILTRPIVEAGEHLGFLPGEFADKVSPYMTPLYDCLNRIVQDPGQKMAVNAAIEVAPIAFLRGRAQPLDATIFTPDGPKLMEEIRVGEQVIGGDGKPVNVSGIYPQGQKNVYKVEFSDGSFTECCEDHLWLTQTLSEKRHDKGYSIKSLKSITAKIKTNHQKNHKIPLVKGPVQFNSREILIDPYLLGLLLGDGCLHKAAGIKFSTKDIDLIEEIKKRLPEGMRVNYAKECDYRLVYNQHKKNPLKKLLKDLNLLGTKSHNKFIPDVYKFNDVNVRLEILRGLLDTDGWIGVTKSGNNRVQYYSTSERLSADVIFLVQSLGGIAYRRVREFDKDDVQELRGHIIRHVHVVDINLPQYNPFNLKRKVEKYCKCYPLVRLISNIKLVGNKECQCIKVDNEDGLYLTNNFIVTHNTFHNSICIFDEAQNATTTQLKLFLTRLGENSKIIVTGDPSQTDIGASSGLTDVVARLETVSGIGIIKFKKDSIVRHPLVAAILEKLED